MPLASRLLGSHFCIHPLIPAAATLELRRPLHDAVQRLYVDGFEVRADRTRIRGCLLPTREFLERHAVGNFRLMLFESNSPGLLNVNLSWEQVPDLNNSLALDEHERDLFGQPRVSLHWTLGELDDRTANAALDLLEEAIADRPSFGQLRRLHLGGTPRHWPVESGLAGLKPGDHHMGTVRMATIESDGVADRNGKLHGYSNFFVSGTSLFPSGGCATPTLTAVALALAQSDHLRQLLASARI